MQASDPLFDFEAEPSAPPVIPPRERRQSSAPVTSASTKSSMPMTSSVSTTFLVPTTSSLPTTSSVPTTSSKITASPSRTTSSVCATSSMPMQWSLPTKRASAQPIEVISPLVAFVLGFSLASIGWLGSNVAGERAVNPAQGPSLAAVEPVLLAATPSVTPAAAQTEPAPAGRPARKNAAPPIAAPRPQVTASAAVLSGSRAPSARVAFRGSLAVTSQPNGAQVLLNGALVGKTPTVLENLPAGSRVLLVQRDGYASWSSSIRVVADQRTSIRASLEPMPNP